MNTTALVLRLAFVAILPVALFADLPNTLPYQGRVAVDGANFSGDGKFKFAIYEHATGVFTPASAAATVTNGFVTSVTVLDGGAGYSSGVTVAFNGVGNGATATATVVEGRITGVAIVNPGSGYSTAPTVVLTEPTAPAQLWNNASGESPSGAALEEPRFPVELKVRHGLYAVGLGDTALTSMQPLPASLAPAPGKRAFLRVWFEDGVHGFQALAPDTELHAVPFAREAASVGGVALAGLARLDSANTFTHIAGLTVTGIGPSGGTPAAGATVPLSGAGTRMEFIPGYGAFRAGTVDGNQWNAANIGLHSTAFGYNTTASGPFSLGSGFLTTASNTCSTALGFVTIASGSTSTALGYYTTASGAASTAVGVNTTASGEASTAAGYFSAARGNYSTAFGYQTNAESAYETVFGRCDTGYTPLSTTGWNPADRLFVIGNGLTDSARSDALVVLKTGNTTLNGTLRVNALNGLAVVGAGPSGSTPASNSTVPVTGPGTRMIFLPGYGALRAGTVTDTQWDGDNIGMHSVALGQNTIASGYVSTALGTSTTANGDYSTAMGVTTKASGNYATALGRTTTASGDYSTALGRNTTANGDYSTALGYGSVAAGHYSTALGFGSFAAGACSTALGLYTTAESYGETVVGSYDTDYTPLSTTEWNPADRLFVVGCGTSGTARENAMTIYKNGKTYLSGDLVVLGSGAMSGAAIYAANGSALFQGDVTVRSLTQTSDCNRKTDIVPADTAAILAGVAALPVSTWKFKDDTTTHLGPMAQDFRATFQLGNTDTGIASVDADGVALAAIQELAKQNTVLKSELAELKARLAALEAKLQ